MSLTEFQDWAKKIGEKAMDKVEDKLKKQIRIHLELLAETNMYTNEMGITTTDLYNLFQARVQQYATEVSRERALGFEMHKQKMVSGRQKDLHIYNFLADYDEWLNGL